MIMASLEFMGDIPFTEVYFNGMIRDLDGRKMSKSLGNSPDPLWLIDGADGAEHGRICYKRTASIKNGVPAYGADAIRLTMVYLTPLGGDVRFRPHAGGDWARNSPTNSGMPRASSL